MPEDLRVEYRGSVGWVIIDRGDGRNSLRPQTLGELIEAIQTLTEAPHVRAIVLAAEGKHFSAGADFAFLEDLTRTPAMQIKDQIYGLFQGAARELFHCPKPTVAAIQGAAVTVGCELALSCDFRIVAPGAAFQEAWIKLGILPPLGGLYLLPRLVGLGRAAEIALSGRPVPAEEAVRIGLASEVTGNVEVLHERAQTFALSLADLPPLAYREAKIALHRGLATSMESEWASNVLAQSLLLGTGDFIEGLAAAKDRRQAQFTGA